MGDNNNYHHGDNLVVDQDDETFCHKSKRLRIVQHALVTNYQCGNAILTRAWEGQMSSGSHYDMFVVREKYTKLSTLIRGSCVINVGGMCVTGKD